MKEKALKGYGNVLTRIETFNKQLDDVEKIQISLRKQVEHLNEVEKSVKTDLIHLDVTVDELMRYKPKNRDETLVQKNET